MESDSSPKEGKLKFTAAVFQRDRLNLIVRWLILAVGIVSVTLLFPGGGASEYSELRLNSINRKKIIAPYEFEILKSTEQVKSERQQARASVPPIFKRVGEIDKRNLSRLDSILSLIGGMLLNSGGDVDSIRNAAFARISTDYHITLNQDIINPSEGEMDQDWWRPLAVNLRTQLKTVYDNGILDQEPDNISAPGNTISILSNGIEKHTQLFSVYTISLAKSEILRELKSVFIEEDRRINIGYEIVLHLLEPNLIYDKNLTQQRRNITADRVPIAKGIVLKSEKIIDANEKVTQAHLDKIRSLIKKREELAQQEGGSIKQLPQAGKFIFVTGVFLLLGLLIFSFEANRGANRYLLLLLLIMLSHLAFLQLVLRTANLSDILFPVSLAAMLATIFCGPRIGFWYLMALVLLAGAFRGGEYQFTMLNLLVGTVAILSVRDLRSRTQLLRSSLYLGTAYIVFITAYHFMQYSFSTVLLQDLGFGVLNALLTPILALGFAIILGNIFNITTDLTLLELSDLNRPLLKQLAAVAPGTYHHSIMVGTLAESAAETVDANPLLARTAAYYHDIGKIERRDYFVENQFGFNPHDTIPPQESAAILASHVQSGLEKAEKNRLPQVIKDVIAQHHGSTTMSYFYHKALTQKGAEVDADVYRYSGPLPVSRESGIIMLADGVEAAVRSTGQAAPEQIRRKVKEIIEGRYAEGQLDQCLLSLKDLQTVKESFVSTLVALSHQRISYPSHEQMNRVSTGADNQD